MSTVSYFNRYILKKIPIHLIVASSAWVSGIITAVFTLLSTRILTDGLGTNNYAAFALITGLAGWYLLVDLGMGSSLQNFISELRATEKSYYKYISNIFILTFVLGAIWIIVLYFLSPLMSSVFLKQVNFIEQVEKNKVFFVAGTLYIIFSLSSISYKIWYAEMKGYLSNLLPAVASIISFLGTAIVSYSSISDKLYWSCVAFIAPTSLIAICSFLMCTVKIPKASWKLDLKIIKEIFKRGFNFWFFALMSAVVLQIDYIVMSQFAPSKDIVIYNIATKIYILVFFIYNAVLKALWPVFTETTTKGKWNDVKIYLKKYISLGILYVIISTVFLIILMPFMVEIISPNLKITIPPLFIVVLGIYYIIRVWTDTFAILLQSMSHMRPFLIWTPFQAMSSFILQWLFVPQYSIYGVLIGLIGSYLLTVLWAVPLAVFRYIKGKQTELKIA